VGELLAGAERLGETRRRKEAKRAATERARRELEEAEARERHLADLAKHEVQTWSQVDVLIATKQPGKYDQAVKLLCDLRDLGIHQGRADEVQARLRQLYEEHAKKSRFLERLQGAGLV
jgi:hypothetical protein